MARRRLLLTVVLIAGLGLAASTGVRAQADRGRDRMAVPDRPVGPMTWMFAGRAGRLGVSVRDVTTSDVERGPLPSAAGAWIVDVHPGSAAEAAGWRQDDVLVEFDGARVRSARQLARLVAETPAGRSVPTRILRGGVTVTGDVELGSRDVRIDDWLPDLDRFGFRIPHIELPEIDVDVRFGPGALGISVEPLSDQLARYFEVSDGVLVSSVREGSPAAAADLRAGDVITAIDGSPVSSPRDVQRATRRASGSVTLDVTRDGQSITVDVELRERDRELTRRGQPL
jgi:S1-C subfamily serine protease